MVYFEIRWSYSLTNPFPKLFTLCLDKRGQGKLENLKYRLLSIKKKLK